MYIRRIDKEDLSDLAGFLSLDFMTDYVMDEKMFAYGMYSNQELVGTVVLRDEIEEIAIQYINVSEGWEMFVSALLNDVIYDMYHIGAQRLVYKFIENPGDKVVELLESMEFTVCKNDIAMFKFTIKQLLEVPILNKSANNVIALDAVDNIRLRALCSNIAEAGEDIIDMPISASDYVGDCSAVYMEGDTAKGVLLLSQDETGLIIPFIYSSSTNPMAIVEMMKFMLGRAKTKFDENEECRTYVVDTILVKIVEKLTGIAPMYQQSAVYDLSNIKHYIDEYNNIF